MQEHDEANSFTRTGSRGISSKSGQEEETHIPAAGMLASAGQDVTVSPAEGQAAQPEGSTVPYHAYVGQAALQSWAHQ